MKKCILFLMSAALLFACGKDEEDNNGGGGGGSSDSKATVVRVGASTLTFEAIGAESQEVKVYADGSWTSEAPDWVTLDPVSGSGTVTVKVTVTDNEDTEGRVGTVVFAPDLLSSTTNKVTIQQKGDNKVNLKTGADFAEWLAGLNGESLDEARLAADIDMNGITLVPAEGFAGVLDGEGHSIRNLHSTQPLFKKNGGTLKNIVIDSSCSFEPDSIVFGALVTRNEGIVVDCVNKAPVTRTIAPTSEQSNLVAGVVGLSVSADFTLSGCKNYGKISLIVSDEGKFTTQAVAGVIAYSRGHLSGCENYGEVSLSGGYHAKRACLVREPDNPENTETGEFYNQKVGTSIGGVAAHALGNTENCKNEGTISWTESRIDDMTTSPARFFTGGVVGTYRGTVTDCTNSGAIVVKSVSSDGQDYTGQNHQHCIGGVAGAFNNPTNDAPSKNRGSNVSGCSNTGNISMESNASKSWIHLGGLIGWPASDNDNTDPANWGVLSSSTNSGTITITGTAKFRCGGLVGATPYMENCSNTGNIIIKGANGDCEVGGVAGRHWGFAQTLKNCSSAADITSDVATDGFSGYIGWIGNNVSATIEGGSVSGHVSAAAGATIGMLSGGLGGDSVTVTFGTATAPIEVSGTVNGTAITAENATTLLWGAKYNPSVHSFNYVIK